MVNEAKHPITKKQTISTPLLDANGDYNKCLNIVSNCVIIDGLITDLAKYRVLVKNSQFIIL